MLHGMADTKFKRSGPHFTDRITARSSSVDGPDANGEWAATPGRYRLVVSRACPWASRAIIVRRLLGLEDAISMAATDPNQDERSWRFSLDPDGRDPVLGIPFLHEAYDARQTGYRAGFARDQRAYEQAPSAAETVHDPARPE